MSVLYNLRAVRAGKSNLSEMNSLCHTSLLFTSVIATRCKVWQWTPFRCSSQLSAHRSTCAAMLTHTQTHTHTSATVKAVLTHTTAVAALPVKFSSFSSVSAAFAISSAHAHSASGVGGATALSDKGSRLDLSEKRPLPSSASIVIIGGGVIGCSVAYHLAKAGAASIVLLEQGSIGCGTTWHAAGLVGQMRSTNTETQLSGIYGSQLYSTLEAETGVATGYKRCGSITIARTKDRLTHLKRQASRARAYGIEAHIISPDEAGRLYHGLMRTDDLTGALWLPNDASAVSSDLTASLAAGAKTKGVQIFERTRVEKIHVQPRSKRIEGITTNRGRISCDVLVNCGGQWARQIGALAGVNVPLHSAEHFYIVSKPFNPPVDRMLPIMRDPDAYTYYREWSGGLVMGGFEPQCKPCFTHGVPKEFEFALLPEDWDHFDILMRGALERVPALETAEVKMVNGPESFTSDNQYILGEAPEVRRFYVAAGFNSSGIASAGGAGRALAEWIVNDAPTMDLWPVDIRRFAPFSGSAAFLRDRTFETLGLHYQIPWPRREMESGRPARRSPLYPNLRDKNALFGSKFGWERANVFFPPLEKPRLQYSFHRQNWFPFAKAEHQHTRSHVSIFDQTSFAKFVIQGTHALSFLQRVCTANMDVEDGKVVYTGMCNVNGGMETDCTITRTSHEEFFMVTSTAQAVRDLDWLRRQKAADEFVTFTDVTSAYATLAVMGPNSRQLMQRAAPTHQFDNSHFPFGTAQTIYLGYAQCRAHRITYVGELGWELYVPTEFAVSVYDHLFQCSRGDGRPDSDLQLRDCGYYAIDSLRLEKGYRAWGADLSPDYSPLESGLAFAVKFDKQQFIGRAALLKQKNDGLRRRLVHFTFADPAAYPLGDEPIFRNGELVGYTTSANYGHTIGTANALGYVRKPNNSNLNAHTSQTSTQTQTQTVDKEWIESPDAKYTIEVNSVVFEVKASLTPPFDPKSERVKA